jgi:hypothetical protein
MRIVIVSMGNPDPDRHQNGNSDSDRHQHDADLFHGDFVELTVYMTH